jgi:hypothetical protein
MVFHWYCKVQRIQYVVPSEDGGNPTTRHACVRQLESDRLASGEYDEGNQHRAYRQRCE